MSSPKGRGGDWTPPLPANPPQGRGTSDEGRSRLEGGPEARSQQSEPLLEVRDLKVYFPFRRGNIFRPEQGFIRAVDGVSFAIQPGETLGLVGESDQMRLLFKPGPMRFTPIVEQARGRPIAPVSGRSRAKVGAKGAA